MTQPVMLKAEVERFYEDLQDLELTPKNDVLFIIGDWNTKVGSQEIPGVTGKFGLGVQSEAGQRQSFAKRTHWSWQTHSSNNTREDTTHGHHQMVNTEIRLVFLQPKMENLYTVRKSRPGADCGLDHEVLIENFILKFKKVCKDGLDKGQKWYGPNRSRRY